MWVHGQDLTASTESWGEPYGRGLGEWELRLQAGRWVGQWGTQSDLCFHCREDRGSGEQGWALGPGHAPWGWGLDYEAGPAPCSVGSVGLVWSG